MHKEIKPQAGMNEVNDFNMIAFLSLTVIGIVSVIFWKFKIGDGLLGYALWVAGILLLAYFIFSPQCLGDIIKQTG